MKPERGDRSEEISKNRQRAELRAKLLGSSDENEERLRQSLPRAKALTRRPPLPPTQPTPPSSPTSPPPLVPAGMIKEALYCERLAYMRWVQGEDASNEFMAEGEAVERRVAQSKGDVSPQDAENAAEADRKVQATQVWLSSERLGITAKIDVLESKEDGSVLPVEYKRGKVPAVPEKAYLPERAQVAAQVMLLREEGYRCDGGIIYFAGSRSRVDVQVDQDLESVVLRTVERIRDLASQPNPPPPLRNSPKCEGCSLVGICLPDELTLLEDLQQPDEQSEVDQAPQPQPTFARPEPPLQEPDPWGLTAEVLEQEQPQVRKLLPARDDKVPLYVQEQGARITLSGENLIVKRRSGAAQSVKLPMLSQVSVFGNVQITTQTLKALFRRGIPVQFFSYGGWYLGRTQAFSTKNVQLRIAQVKAIEDQERCLRLARGFVQRKLKNSRTMLRRNGKEVPAHVLKSLKMAARKASKASSLDELLGIEGAGAHEYFASFSRMLKAGAEAGFQLDGRNRRPPRDPVNSMLSYAYSLLTKDLTRAAEVAGLDPMLGFYHQLRFGRPSLALDLMEEFRPIVADSVVVRVMNEGVVGPDDFLQAGGGVTLKSQARKRFIEAYERRMDQLVTHPVFGYRISYRRVFEVQARLLARVVTGELDEYPGFVTR